MPSICENAPVPEVVFLLAPSPLVLQPLIAIKLKLNKTQEAISVKRFGNKALVPLSKPQKTTCFPPRVSHVQLNPALFAPKV